MALTAVDSGRQRSLLQNAQNLVAELRALPLDPATTRASYPTMFELVRIVKRYSEATAALPADDTRAMWEQRGQWLQEEVAGLAQERIYSPDQSQYWLNLLLLLFAGAEACDRALREKLELDLALQAANRQTAELQEQLRRARLEAEEAAQRTAVPPGLADELLELRSKVAVLGAELDKGREALAGAAQQMQLLTAERDSLRQQVDGLRGELAAVQRTADSRAEVIQQLMQRTEANSGQGAAAIAELARLQGHCRTLGVNLENNAKVIEKLVELNSELMDAMNAATATQEQRLRATKAPGAGAPPEAADAASAAAAAAATGLGGRRESWQGGGSGGGAGPASAQGQAAEPRANGGSHARTGSGSGLGFWGLTSGSTAAAASAAPAAAPSNGTTPPPQPPAGLPRVPSRGGALGSGAAASTSGRAGGGGGGGGNREPVSLTDAFAAFLRDETPPKPATAEVLAAPPPPLPPLPGASPLAAHRPGADGGKAHTRSGRGLGGGLMSVVRYVAGSDRGQQGTSGTGASAPTLPVSNGTSAVVPGAEKG